MHKPLLAVLALVALYGSPSAGRPVNNAIGLEAALFNSLAASLAENLGLQQKTHEGLNSKRDDGDPVDGEDDFVNVEDQSEDVDSSGEGDGEGEGNSSADEDGSDEEDVPNEIKDSDVTNDQSATAADDNDDVGLENDSARTQDDQAEDVNPPVPNETHEPIDLEEDSISNQDVTSDQDTVTNEDNNSHTTRDADNENDDSGVQQRSTYETPNSKREDGGHGPSEGEDDYGNDDGVESIAEESNDDKSTIQDSASDSGDAVDSDSDEDENPENLVNEQPDTAQGDQ